MWIFPSSRVTRSHWAVTHHAVTAAKSVINDTMLPVVGSVPGLIQSWFTALSGRNEETLRKNGLHRCSPQFWRVDRHEIWDEKAPLAWLITTYVSVSRVSELLPSGWFPGREFRLPRCGKGIPLSVTSFSEGGPSAWIRPVKTLAVIFYWIYLYVLHWSFRYRGICIEHVAFNNVPLELSCKFILLCRTGDAKVVPYWLSLSVW